MKIASIHIYSHDGRRRDLPLNPDGLNIITGLASTGKSSLSDTRGLGLLAEARVVGIPFSNSAGINAPSENGAESDLVASLREVLTWRPGQIPLLADSEMAKLQTRRSSLRTERRQVQDQIASVQRYVKGASDFQTEVQEQRSRLKSINALPLSPSGAWGVGAFGLTRSATSSVRIPSRCARTNAAE